MKITSQPLTLVDTTDSRKLEVYISSNHPNTQLYNVNNTTNKYTPDWSTTNLKLNADIFLDSKKITPEKKKWYRQTVNGSEEDLFPNTDYTEEVIVSANMTSAIVTYMCKVEYQGLTAFSKITFTKTDTGRNGTDGKDGTSVTIDGTAYYNEILSDDMVGQLISLYADDEFTTLLGTSSMVEGDSYVVQGYLCVYSPTNDKFICVGRIQGPKGEDGDSAKSIVLSGDSQVFKGNKNTPIVYIPNTIKLTVNRINIPTTTTLTWSYNHNDNKGWTTVKPDSVVISGDTATITGASMITDSLTIKVSDGTIEDVFTVYRAFDGADGVKGDTASMAFLTNENTSFPAGADGKTNVLTTFRTNVVAYNGTEKVTPTIGSISDIYGNLPDGMSVVPNKGTAYAKVELTANNAVISDLYSDKDTKNVINKSKLTNGDSFVVGDYLYKYDSTNQNFKSNTVTVDEVTYLDRIVANNEITLLFSVPTGKNLGKDGNAVGEVTIPVISPVSTNLLLSWTKINAGPEGEPGVGINKIDVEYGKSENLDIKPENISWSSTIPIVEDGLYLWTKTIIDYTDPNKQDTVTYTYAKQGSKGDIGTSISEVDIEYIASNNPTTPPSSGWSPVVIATTVEKPYLWTKTTFKLEDGATKNAYSVARYGTDGAMGAPGVDAVTFQIYSSNGYALSTNTPTVTLQTFAYIGDVEITAGATYQWYVYDDTGWTAMTNNTDAYLTVTREDVEFSKSYMCKMVFNSVEYTSVATIDDKNDTNKVFTSKPSNYTAGDLWVVGVDYAPTGIEVGTLLKAEHTNAGYEDSDWITSLKYDEKLRQLEDSLETYNQYFSFDSTDGLKISAKDLNGTPSQFSTSLTNERLSFNYGNESIAYINGTKMNIKEAEIESPLTITGKYSGSTMLQAPVINIGNFSIIVESNGSLSIVANT